MRYRSTTGGYFRSGLLLILLLTGSAFAQEPGPTSKYGAVTVKVGTIGKTNAVFVGGCGGWNLDRNYGVGIAGYLLVGGVPARTSDASGDSRMMAGYGGLEVEYLVPLDSSFQISAQALVGGGAVGFVENRYADARPHYHPFIAFEPGVNFDIALIRFFRLTFGAGYRFVGLLSSPVAGNSDMNGPTFSISVKAGLF